MTKKYRLHEKAWKCRPAFKLVNENWTLCHEIVSLRDGDRCVLEDIKCKGGLQLDHTISRNCKKLFFETVQLNYLCAHHHSSKSFNPGDYADLKVQEITRERAGEAWWKWALVMSDRRNSSEICHEWKTVYHQEEIKFKLIDELFKLKEKTCL